ncbi:MAG: hypothetical protein M3O23_02115 [Actinomycetota bacterium]|nr:hypothetical protein [Actinomycetota bacterium]
MTASDDLIALADDDYCHSRFKEAHIKYGQAFDDGPRDNYCRRMRGMCSRRVAEERLRKAEEQPARRQAFLQQAARWLAKAEANLDSALEEAGPDERAAIRQEQARTEEAIARFMEMSGKDSGRRLALARSYRAEENGAGAD